MPALLDFIYIVNADVPVNASSCHTVPIPISQLVKLDEVPVMILETVKTAFEPFLVWMRKLLAATGIIIVVSTVPTTAPVVTNEVFDWTLTVDGEAGPVTCKPATDYPPVSLTRTSIVPESATPYIACPAATSTT